MNKLQQQMFLQPVIIKVETNKAVNSLHTKLDPEKYLGFD